MNSNKAQLSIFILLAVFIVIILIFLFSSSLSNQEETIEDSAESYDGRSQSFSSLEEELDFCLLKSTRKATIISGYLGGYIYTNLTNTGSFEKYSPSISYSQYYDDGFLSNMGISPLYLSSNTLFYHTSELHVPPIEASKAIMSNGEMKYGRGIEYDYEKYILDEISSCLDFSKYEQEGFLINNYDISGSLFEKKNSNTILIDNIDAEIGNTITIMLESNKYSGEVVEEKENGVYRVKFTNDPFLNNNNIQNIINTDLGVEVDVDFQEEQITSRIDFPLRVDDNEKESLSTISTSVTLENRFLKFQEIMRILISEKQTDKSLDYSNASDVNEVLQKKSSYFNSLENPQINFHKTVIEESDEYKHFVYTLADSDKTIQGNEFVFNAAYQNHAPKIDLSYPDLQCNNIGSSSYDVFSNDSTLCVLVVAEDETFSYDLLETTRDIQGRDNYAIGFEEVEESSNVYFRVKSDGTMEFRSSAQNVYDRTVTVTDGGATRDYDFRFVVGAPENENNQDANSCINFKNSIQEDNLYPIDSKYENEIFVSNQGDREIPYGYVLETNSQFSFSLRDSCFQYGSSLEATMNVKDNSGNEIVSSETKPIDGTFTFNQPNPGLIPQYYSVKFQIKDNSGNSFLDEPYELILYPVKCLGPEAYDEKYSDTGEVLATINTCCDMNALKNHKDNSNHPVAPPEIIKEGNTFSYDFFFAIDKYEALGGISTEEEILWEETSLNEKIASLYKGTAEFTCKGTHPRFQQNFDKITSSSSDRSGTIESVIIKGESADISTTGDNGEYSLHEDQEGKICGDSVILEAPFTFRGSDGFRYAAGFEGTIEPITNTGSATKYLCEDEWYGTAGSVSPFSSWNINNVDWTTNTVSKSKVFCSDGSYECSKFDPEESKTPSQCEKAMFDGTDIKLGTDSADGDLCDGPDVVSENETHERVKKVYCSSGSCSDSEYNWVEK